MRFGQFQYFRYERLLTPIGYTHYAKHHGRHCSELIRYSFWALLRAQDPDAAYFPPPDTRAGRRERLSSVREALTRVLSNAAKKLNARLPDDAPLGMLDPTFTDETGWGWTDFIHIAVDDIRENTAAYSVEEVALIALHTADRAIAFMRSPERRPLEDAVDIGASVQEAFFGLQLAVDARTERQDAIREMASKGGKAKHAPNEKDKAFVKDAWQTNGHRYKGRTAFARDMLEKVEVKDPKTILKWLKEPEANQ